MALNEWLVSPEEWRRRADMLGAEIQRMRNVVQRGTEPEPWAARVAPAVLQLADSFRAWRNAVSENLLTEALGLYSGELRGWSKKFDALQLEVLRARSAAGLPALAFATDVVPDQAPLVEVKGHPVLWMLAGAGLLYLLNEHTKGK